MKEDYLFEEANGGNMDAMYLLATLYWEDDRIDNAFKWYSKAAEKGHADATYYIGLYYWHPTGYGIVEPSDEKAVEYCAKAAELGSPRAMCELGRLAQDIEKAVKLFEKAAALEYHEGYRRLADCYKNGNGVEKNIEKALEYAEKAYEALRKETEWDTL